MTDPTVESPSRLQQLFLGALDLPAERRDSWLREQCGDDESLFRQVNALLSEDDRSFDPLEQRAQSLIREALDNKLHGLEHGLHVRCPHCRIPIELIEDREWNEIDCPSCGSTFSLTSTDETILGERPGKHERIAHFTLNEQVGVGAFGTVWNATDTELDRTVALKIPRKGQLSADESEKFLREARAAAQLKHPNIVSVHEVGRDGETIYIVSDFIKGLSLADWLTGQKPKFRETVEQCLKVCDALQHAHSHGVIHRDLKPGNILLDQEFNPHLTDFGLAKRDAGEITMTLDGQILGTPAYMSPEQARGEGHSADARSDVYSVGVILFELLTGERPFRGNTRMMLHQLLNEDAPSPRKLHAAVPRDLETICLKCLEKDPHKRYSSASELQSDLQCFLDHKPIAARPVGRFERSWRWCKRKPAIASLTAVVLLLLLLLGIGGPIVAVTQSVLANSLSDELRLSKAMRLAAQSQSVGDELPVRSLLLAIEAVQTTRRHDESILPIARESLFEAVAHVSGRACVGHDDAVIGVAISPDGHWLATSSRDKTARLWDLTADDPVTASKVLRGHENVLGSVAFSPDGRWLATGSWDKTVRLWDLRASDPATSFKVLRGHQHVVGPVAFSPDGRWLATGSFDRTARLWDMANLTADDPEKSSHVLSHEGFVNHAEFSPDGRWLATGSRDGTARLWKMTERGPATSPIVLMGHAERLTSVAFSPDGRWFATSGNEQTARLWDMTTMMVNEPPKAPLELKGHEDWVDSVTFSPDGRWLATWSVDRTARLWNLTKDDPSAASEVLHGHEGMVNSAAFSPDGRWLATSSDDRTVRLWDLQAEVPAASSLVLRGHEKAVYSLTFSPDGRWLATGSGDHTARLWDLTVINPALSSVVLSHESWVHSVACSPDGHWLATGSENHSAQLWDLTLDDPGHSSRELAGHKGSVIAVEFSPDSRWLATASKDGTARLWDLAADDPATSFKDLRGGHKGWVSNIAFSPDGRLLATVSYDYSPNGDPPTYSCEVRLWDLTTGDRATSKVLLRHDRIIDSVAFSPDGRWLATASWDQTARLWDLTEADPAASSIVLSGHEGKVVAISFSPDNHWLATGSWDKTARLWDLTSDDPATSFKELRGHAERLTSVAFSPDGRWLVTGSDDKTARLWDLKSGDANETSIELRGHDDILNSVMFSPDGHWLATCSSRDTTTRLWDFTADDPSETAIVLRGHQPGKYDLYSFAFSPDGRWLATVSNDKTARLWDLDIDSLIDRARRAAGRELTPEERKQYMID